MLAKVTKMPANESGIGLSWETRKLSGCQCQCQCQCQM